MLILLKLPIELLWIGWYALSGVCDWLRGRDKLRVEASALMEAPRNLSSIVRRGP